MPLKGFFNIVFAIKDRVLTAWRFVNRFSWVALAGGALIGFTLGQFVRL